MCQAVRAQRFGMGETAPNGTGEGLGALPVLEKIGVDRENGKFVNL